MVNLYPYELWAQQTAESTLANGKFIAGAIDWTRFSECRDEVSGQGRLVQLEDGTTSVFEAIIYLPRLCPAIKPGTGIEVRDEAGTVRQVGTAKRFQRDRLHARLWL